MINHIDPPMMVQFNKHKIWECVWCIFVSQQVFSKIFFEFSIKILHKNLTLKKYHFQSFIMTIMFWDIDVQFHTYKEKYILISQCLHRFLHSKNNDYYNNNFSLPLSHVNHSIFFQTIILGFRFMFFQESMTL